MPIRPSERARYPRNWREISAKIRERDGDACRWCHAPNGERVRRKLDDPGRWIHECDYLAIVDGIDWSEAVKIVITVAHLDHTPENCDFGNLVALCQRCHLTYDAAHHARNARRTRRQPLAVRDLFEAP